ncbi:MAG: DNA-methyltransferase [Sphingomonadaceae bacterium]
MEATLSVWDIPAEKASKVGHPAPFPIELPKRFIELYTYPGELVLDPFMGSGSTAVAAALAERRWVGYDISPVYCDLTRRRAGEAVSQTPLECGVQPIHGGDRVEAKSGE